MYYSPQRYRGRVWSRVQRGRRIWFFESYGLNDNIVYATDNCANFQTIITEGTFTTRALNDLSIRGQVFKSWQQLMDETEPNSWS